jgi:hypothetical protein
VETAPPAHPHPSLSRARPALAGLAALLAGWALAAALGGAPAPLAPSPPSKAAHAERQLGALPLSFEENRGQAGAAVDYIARMPGGSLLLGPSGARVRLAGAHGRQAALSLRLPGSAPAEPRALDPLPGKVNYLVGDDPSEWRTDIPTSARVRYPEVWPGIDLDWHGDGRRLEYAFRLAPGVDPAAIALRVGGARGLRVAANGDLVIAVAGGTVRQRAPVAYQPKRGRRDPVPASFSVEGRRIGFSLGPHDPTRPLVIDPVLVYSTYLGGNSVDTASHIAVDSTGAAYVTGQTFSTDFNQVNPIMGEDDPPGADAFVSKLNPAGSALVYSTYLGGDASDGASGIAVDSAGAAYVAGQTDSTNFCTGAGCSVEGDSVGTDAFVAKLTPAGNALAYSTYLGGDGSDSASGIAIDSSGAAYVTGVTGSSDFCTGLGCSIEGDSALDDAFISKLNPAGSALVYSTYLGGDASDLGNGIAVDSAGAAYVTGQTDSNDFCTGAGCSLESHSDGFDAFVSKLTPAGSGLAYSTYLGADEADFGFGIAVDSAGAAYVTGQTDSTDFDTVGPIEGDSALDDAFVSKLNPAGSGLAYSTYFGGDASDIGTAIAVDSAGAAYVTGQTISTDFDTVNPIEGDSAVADSFVSKLTPAGSGLAYSTYLGGDGIDSGFGIAVDSAGAAYVTGSTDSTDFDTVGQIEGDSASFDAFVFKVGEPQPPLAGLSPAGPPGTGPSPTAAATCAGKPAMILGTDKKDVLTGTERADVIAGLGGRDRIRGLGGDDRICGGKGGDRVNPGAGQDRVLGQAGNDTLSGGGGNDRLNGGKGKDRLIGGPGGRDLCAGGASKRDRAAGSCEREPGVP